jgi:hypothetical protein
MARGLILEGIAGAPQIDRAGGVEKSSGFFEIRSKYFRVPRCRAVRYGQMVTDSGPCSTRAKRNRRESASRCWKDFTVAITL